ERPWGPPPTWLRKGKEGYRGGSAELQPYCTGRVKKPGWTREGLPSRQGEDVTSVHGKHVPRWRKLAPRFAPGVPRRKTSLWSAHFDATPSRLPGISRRRTRSDHRVGRLPMSCNSSARRFAKCLPEPQDKLGNLMPRLPLTD